MEKQEITCINCPVGCRMEVEVEDGQVKSVKGNACKRGETYAKQESVAPQRMVTAVAPVDGSEMPVSLKTQTPIPKARIKDCMNEIAALNLKAPIAAGQVVIGDVCGTGVSVIATKAVP